ncbi:tetratricopeptide repeat protein [Acetobacter sp. AN02]|uniref:tetratricopeptide repeat protein n=1 Tax=Acetobacter sp. AN02 TaxID=2894186 RepID=UPI0024340EDC|nr:tetratricopeptide repeat protein [Acetobacter sp. AN02]MDG6095425.1 tetratricopeptide repeat protein [Acetobacter sp. AN02]
MARKSFLLYQRAMKFRLSSFCPAVPSGKLCLTAALLASVSGLPFPVQAANTSGQTAAVRTPPRASHERPAAESAANKAPDAASAEPRLPEGWKQQTLTPPVLPKPAANAAPGAPAPGSSVPAVQAEALPPPPDSSSRIFLPVRSGTGVAAFWSGKDFLIVLDHATAFDRSALAGSVNFASLDIHDQGDATILTLHTDHPQHFSLSKQTGGWILTAGPDQVPVAPGPVIIPRRRNAGMLFPLPAVGRVVTLTDPATGARLLIGTSQDMISGGATIRHAVGYEILPSVQGLVIAADSDQLGLRPADEGMFLDATGMPGLPVGQGSTEMLASVPEDWSWITQGSAAVPALRENYRRLWTEAAMTPPGRRTGPRLAAARAAFMMGDARQARAILFTLMTDDPSAQNSPDITLLSAMSSFMIGDMDAASVLNKLPGQGGHPDESLWRGLYTVRTGDRPADAAGLLAASYNRLSGYPQPLRALLQPEIAENIARFGSEADRKVLSSMPAGPEFSAARALLLLRSGQDEAALSAFDKLALSPSTHLSEVGLEEGIRLREKLGQITHLKAAEAFDRMRLTARMTGREADVQLSMLDAYAQAGDWRNALMLCDAIAELFPAHRAALQGRVSGIVSKLAQLPPPGSPPESNSVDIIALIESHLEMIPDSPEKGQILASLGDRLSNLGLPAQAATAYERALPFAPGDQQRGEWGAKLASADVAARRLGPARKALDDTATSSLSTDIASQRKLVSARILLQQGEKERALEMLSGDENAEALDMRGRILEESHKWQEAVLIVGRLATKQLPETGPLNEIQQNLSLRLATDASHTNDWETLQRLRDWVNGRITDPNRQRIFNLLTSRPAVAQRTDTTQPVQN